MSAKQPGRYALPPDGNMLPTDYYCVPVRIPHNEHYLRQFLGMLDYLGKWVAWDDNGSGDAALVAALWKRATELTRQRYYDDTCYTFDALYPDDPPDGRPAAQAEIDDILWYLRDIAVEIIDRLANSETCEDIVSVMAARILAETDIYMDIMLANACADISAMTAQQQADLIDIAHWQEVRNEIYCAYVNGEITYAEYELWLNWLSDQITITLEAASQWLINTLNDAATALAGESGVSLRRAGEAAAGGGAGFGTSELVCPWTVTLNFLAGTGGFERAGTPLSGIHVPGTGWTPEDVLSGDGKRRRIIQIRNTFAQSTTITYVEMQYDVTKGVPDFNVDTFLPLRLEYPAGTIEEQITWLDLVSGSGQTKSHTETKANISTIHFVLWCDIDQTAPVDLTGSCTITGAIISGVGFNPWA